MLISLTKKYQIMRNAVITSSASCAGLSINAIEIPVTLQHSEKEQSIGYCKDHNPQVKSLLLLSVFLSQILELSFGLFGRLSHLPHIVVRTHNLLTLCRQLIQHVTRSLIRLIKRLRRIFQHFGLVRRVKNGRLIAWCDGRAAFLVGIECVRSTG